MKRDLSGNLERIEIMCEPATLTTLGLTAAAYAHQRKEANSTAQSNRQAALVAKDEDHNALNQSKLEETNIKRQKLLDNSRKKDSAKAKAQVNASGRGVEGLSSKAIKGDITRLAGENSANINANYDSKMNQLDRQASKIDSNYLNRLNSNSDTSMMTSIFQWGGQNAKPIAKYIEEY